MKPPRSANRIRPQIEGVPTQEQEDAAMLADIKGWHVAFARVPPCPECGWPFGRYCHIPHE